MAQEITRRLNEMETQNVVLVRISIAKCANVMTKFTKHIQTTAIHLMPTKRATTKKKRAHTHNIFSQIFRRKMAHICWRVSFFSFRMVQHKRCITLASLKLFTISYEMDLCTNFWLTSVSHCCSVLARLIFTLNMAHGVCCVCTRFLAVARILYLPKMTYHVQSVANFINATLILTRDWVKWIIRVFKAHQQISIWLK